MKRAEPSGTCTCEAPHRFAILASFYTSLSVSLCVQMQRLQQTQEKLVSVARGIPMWDAWWTETTAGHQRLKRLLSLVPSPPVRTEDGERFCRRCGVVVCATSIYLSIYVSLFPDQQRPGRPGGVVHDAGAGTAVVAGEDAASRSGILWVVDRTPRSVTKMYQGADISDRREVVNYYFDYRPLYEWYAPPQKRKKKVTSCARTTGA